MANWRYTIDIKSYIDKFEAAEAAYYIAKALREGAQRPEAEDDRDMLLEYADVFDDLHGLGEDCYDEDVNETLEDLYDWADANLVWLGL